MWRGVFDITKQQKELTQKHIDVAKQVFNVLTKMYEVSINTEKNTADTVKELRAAVAELKGINENTSANLRDLGR